MHERLAQPQVASRPRISHSGVERIGFGDKTSSGTSFLVRDLCREEAQSPCDLLLDFDCNPTASSRKQQRRYADCLRYSRSDQSSGHAIKYQKDYL